VKERATRVAAYGLITRGDDMLLCRLASELGKYSGMWTLPGGGVEFGEDPADAVVRELDEETGLHVRPLRIVTIDSNLMTTDERDFHGIRILYEVEVLGGQLRFEKNGSTDRCEWIPRQDAGSRRLVRLAQTGLALAFGAESLA
jgi:8-oxo-dGTP diphosphatase